MLQKGPFELDLAGAQSALMHRQHQLQHRRLEAAIELAVRTARSIWKWLRAGRARREIQG
jgi:hypothetical protein